MTRSCTKCNILVECGEIKPVTKISGNIREHCPQECGCCEPPLTQPSSTSDNGHDWNSRQPQDSPGGLPCFHLWNVHITSCNNFFCRRIITSV